MMALVNESDPKLLDLQSTIAEVQRLREENVRLRRLLQEHGIQIPVQSTNEIPVTTSVLPSAHASVLKAEQRIALFLSLFHGREDVYAVRWENADGRSGYMPKADRDWKAYLRAKDQDRKKVDRLTRKFRPLTDEVVRGHLVGDHTIGIYPLLQDETCLFLAVDFDKKTWQQGCHRVSGRMSRTERASGTRAFTVRQRWPRVDLFRPINPRNHRAKTGLCNPDSGHGVPSPTWIGFIRPLLSQPRHHAKGRTWQPDRVAAAEAPARRWKQRLRRCGVSSI
jgi:hypothetical protein